MSVEAASEEVHARWARPAATILVVDDDPRIRRLAVRVLSGAGYAVLEAGDVDDADRLAREHAPDLAVLDLVLPRGSGDELLRRWRAEGQPTAVVILTGHGNLQHEAALLHAGADDYIAKPFDPRVLVARVGSVLRRVQRAGSSDEPIEAGSVRLWVTERALELNGRQVSLTRTETKLLGELMRRAGEVVTYADIVGVVWGFAYAGQVEMVHTNVYRLRRKLENDSAHPRLLQAIPGVGYRFQTADDSTPPAHEPR